MSDVHDPIQPTPSERASNLAPLLAAEAAKVDESGEFPTASVEALRVSGLFGLMVPTRYGGLGGTLADLAEVSQILAGGCLSTAMIWSMHCQQVESIVRHASSQLCEALLPAVAAGRLYVASVTTEPGPGAHLLGADAALQPGAAGLRIDRVAPIVTGGEVADGFLITMRDSSDATSNRVTLVYAGREQLTVERRSDWRALGMRGTRSVGLSLSGEVPAHQVVGERGDFRTVALETMAPAAHITWAACWLGAARARFADVITLARSSRRPRGLDPTSPLVAARLARIRADLELVSAYLHRVIDEVRERRAAGRTLDSPDTQIHINTLKVVASEHTFRAVDALVEVTGLGHGYLRDSSIPLERTLRDLRSGSLNYANDRLLVTNGALTLLDRAVRLAGAGTPP